MRTGRNRVSGQLGHGNEKAGHVAQMQKEGQWGNEQEIAAAAHLFDCSIMCLLTCTHGQLGLQHFSPHFIVQQTAQAAAIIKQYTLSIPPGHIMNQPLFRLQSMHE